MGHWFEREYIGIVLGVFTFGRKDEMSFLIHRDTDLLEAATARDLGFTVDSPAEIKPVGTGR